MKLMAYSILSLGNYSQYLTPVFVFMFLFCHFLLKNKRNGYESVLRYPIFLFGMMMMQRYMVQLQITSTEWYTEYLLCATNATFELELDSTAQYSSPKPFHSFTIAWGPTLYNSIIILLSVSFHMNFLNNQFLVLFLSFFFFLFFFFFLSV